MATLHAFDTLAYTKALVDRGYERDKAEALAEAQRDFFVKELASEDFVSNEIQHAVEKLNNKIDQKINELDNKIDQLNAKIEREVLASENRTMKSMGKMFVAAVGILLAGIPIIQVLITKFN